MIITDDIEKSGFTVDEVAIFTDLSTARIKQAAKFYDLGKKIGNGKTSRRILGLQDIGVILYYKGIISSPGKQDRKTLPNIDLIDFLKKNYSTELKKIEIFLKNCKKVLDKYI